MAHYKALVRWQTDGGDFQRGRYSRAHTWTFDCGIRVIASASPSVVPQPYSDPRGIDPEEALVASIASCHMLSFLYVAAKAGYAVLSYEDEAVGSMSKNEQGVAWVSDTVLSPSITYEGDPPSEQEEDALHEQAHDECFIAQSVKTRIRTTPTRDRRRTND